MAYVDITGDVAENWQEDLGNPQAICDTAICDISICDNAFEEVGKDPDENWSDI